MPDLPTHALAAYVVLTVASWRLHWIGRRFVPFGMAGAAVPDATKLFLVVESRAVEGVLGLPFDWDAIHTLGPSATIAAIVALSVRRRDRLGAFSALLAGVGSHLLLDLTVRRASGAAPPYLFPLTWWEPPAANLLLSSDPWPWIITATAAVGVRRLDRRRRSPTDRDAPVLRSG